MKHKRLLYITLIFWLAVCIATVIIFGVFSINVTEDEKFNSLFADTIPRLAAGLFVFTVIILSGYGNYRIEPKSLPKSLLWSIPCFLVALANFPLSALIVGSAYVTRVDLVWFLVIKCLSIGFLEESLFRGLILPLLTEKIKGKKSVFLSVIISSALFGVAHLINLFYGSGFGVTILQVGYSFLIGCMLAVMLFRTKNIWLCIIVHALFDFGASIVSELGEGNFQDKVFWILTAIFGVICAVHIIFTLMKLNGNPNVNVEKSDKYSAEKRSDTKE